MKKILALLLLICSPAWAGSTYNPGGPGAGGTPGGTNGQVQFNNNGAFGGWGLGNSLTSAGNILDVTTPVHAQGTAASYTILSTDMGAAVTHARSTAVADTLPQAGTTGFEAGKAALVQNLGAGAVTITATTSLINLGTGGGSSTLVLQAGQGAWLLSDGTNWIAFSGGGGVSLSTAQTWLAGQAVSPVTVSISTSTYTPNFALSNNFNITLVHASCPCTLANPTNVVAGQSGVMVINQSATGSDTITSYGSSYVFTNNTFPTLSTAANATDIFSYYVIDSTHIRLSLLKSTVPLQSRAALISAFIPAASFGTSVNFGIASFATAQTAEKLTIYGTGTETCATPPTIQAIDCGASGTACGSPTTIASLQMSGTSGTSVSTTTMTNASIAANDEIRFNISAGTCAVAPAIYATLSGYAQ